MQIFPGKLYLSVFIIGLFQSQQVQGSPTTPPFPDAIRETRQGASAGITQFLNGFITGLTAAFQGGVAGADALFNGFGSAANSTFNGLLTGYNSTAAALVQGTSNFIGNNNRTRA